MATNAGQASDGGSYFQNPPNGSSTLDVEAGLSYNSTNYHAYLFRSIEGYSKVGSYTGNGVADGTFVYCGFRPAYVLLKREDTGHWVVIDSARDTYNVTDAGLLPATSSSEGTGYPVDILSNGFKLRTTGTAINASVDFIYYAVGDSFKHSVAR